MKEALKKNIKETVPDLYDGRYDVLAIFNHENIFDTLTQTLALDFKDNADVVLAPEAGGWVLGAAIARALNVPFIGVRKMKRGANPKEKMVSVSYAARSGEKTYLEIPEKAKLKNKRVLIVDDWIETGKQIEALIALAERFGATVTGISAISVKANSLTKQWLEKGILSFIDIE